MIETTGFHIKSVVGCWPAQIIDNFTWLSARVDEARAQSILKSTLFNARRIVHENQTVFDLFVRAGQELLTHFSPDQIGAVLVVSFSSPNRFPALSIQLQQALGLQANIITLDIQMACAGYISGLLTAQALLPALDGKYVLLFDGDVQSSFLAQDDVATQAVMSDAATVTCLAPAPSHEKCTFAFQAHADHERALICSPQGPIHMDGFAVFRFVATQVAPFLKNFLAHQPTPHTFIPHQANGYLVRQLAHTLQLTDQLQTAPIEAANPGSCSIPLALASQCVQGEVLLAGFGAGLSMGAVQFNISSPYLHALVELP